MKTLPTTPGSIIKFYSGLELPGEDFWYVATLMPGHIDSDGVAHELIWTTSYEDGDHNSAFTEARILAEDLVRIVSESEPVTDSTEDLELFKDGHGASPGMIIRLTDEDSDVKVTYTYAPGFIFEDDYSELDFVNSYGDYISVARAQLADDLEILYMPKVRNELDS